VKPKNMPGRKLLRQLKAIDKAIHCGLNNELYGDDVCIRQIQDARQVKTQKYRGNR